MSTFNMTTDKSQSIVASLLIVLVLLSQLFKIADTRSTNNNIVATNYTAPTIMRQLDASNNHTTTKIDVVATEADVMKESANVATLAREQAKVGSRETINNGLLSEIDKEKQQEISIAKLYSGSSSSTPKQTNVVDNNEETFLEAPQISTEAATINSSNEQIMDDNRGTVSAPLPIVNAAQIMMLIANQRGAYLNDPDHNHRPHWYNDRLAWFMANLQSRLLQQKQEQTTHNEEVELNTPEQQVSNTR